VGTATVLHFKGESARRSNTDVLSHFYEAMRIFVRRYYRRSPVVPLLYAGIWLRELVARAARLPNLWLLGLADVVGITAALLVATRMRFGSFFGLQPYAYPTVFLVVGGLIAGLMLLFGDYLERRIQISRALMVYGLGFFILASLTYFFKDYAFSRWVVLGTIAGGALWSLAVRIALQVWMWLRQGVSPRRVAVVGTGPTARAVAAALAGGLPGSSGVIFLGFVRQGRERNGSLEDAPVLGEFAELPELLARWHIQELVVTEPEVPVGELISLLDRVARGRVRLYIVHTPDELYVQRFVLELLGQEPAWIRYPLLHPRIRLLKRCVDVCAALWALTLGLPLVFLNSRRWLRIRRWWDVLRGHWSVVGLFPQEGELPDGAKPGLVSLAELAGGEQLPASLVRQLNQYYLRHYSVALDMEIVLKHCVRRFRRETRTGL
jgi:hypothetical protein